MRRIGTRRYWESIFRIQYILNSRLRGNDGDGTQRNSSLSRELVFYNNCAAMADSGLRSLLLRVTWPYSDCPFNFSTAYDRPLDEESR